MNAAYMRDILSRAYHCWESSDDPTYKEILGPKIEALEYAMALDQEVGDIDDIDPNQEMADYLAEQADDLEKSI